MGVAFTTACVLAFSSGTVLRDVALATTPEQQQAGLSNRDSAGQGMLFSWLESKQRVVWMHNTRIPLSVAFIDGDTITSIIDMEPMTDDYHYSTGTATDALELAQGEFQQHGIDVGSTLTRRDCD